MTLSSKLRGLMSKAGLLIITFCKHRPKVRFLAPKPATIVVFDHIHWEFFVELFGNRSIKLFDPRYKFEIYPTLLLPGFFDWLLGGRRDSITQAYFLRFLKSTKPQRVVTSAHFSVDFYSARKALRHRHDMAWAVFQRGVFLDHELAGVPEDPFLTISDRVFTLSDSFKDAWAIKVSCSAKVIAIGTLPTLLKLCQESDGHQGLRVGFLSQWQVNLASGDLRQKFYYLEHSGLKKVAEVVSALDGEFFVIGRSDRGIEKDFFSDIMGASQAWEYKERHDKDGNYGEINNLDLIISAGSTLGFEALAAKKKVVFLSDASVEPSVNGGVNVKRYPARLASVCSPNNPLNLDIREKHMWKAKIEKVMLMNEEAVRELAFEVMGNGAADGNLQLVRQELVNDLEHKGD